MLFFSAARRSVVASQAWASCVGMRRPRKGVCACERGVCGVYLLLWWGKVRVECRMLSSMIGSCPFLRSMLFVGNIPCVSRGEFEELGYTLLATSAHF